MSDVVATGGGLSDVAVRIARPSADLRAAEEFWVEGAGLKVLWRVQPGGGAEHALLMVGAPGARWHLELVEDPRTLAEHPPSAEDLLVFYLGAEVPAPWVERLLTHGGQRVAARNPYWDQWGLTIRDPDGYLLVLSTRAWDPQSA
ncbi:VOC family protein [Granulicoccus sp. GXG6511]|uniref:VOC family protein n=1 Tax=Granulicoccus sp. GXG6511 TaxID=3381351 RepID=UPI003D7DDCA3